MTVDASCEGKKRFETHERAEQVRKRKKKAEKARGVYRCHVCEGYHLGSGKAKSAKTSRRPLDEADRFELEGRN